MAGRTLSMHAVQYDGYGGGAAGLEHVEIPIPSPKKDEVLVKVEAASLNPFDWKIQNGVLRPFLPRKFPYIPVGDVAGEVCTVGPGMENLKEGDKVIAMLTTIKGGGLAEYAVASGNMIAKRPPEVPAAEGSCLGIAALTAFQALKSIGTKFDGTGKPANVLITAASGGVGHYAVQLAKLGNLHVTATCGARNLELVKNLGADEVLDYKTPEGDYLRSPSGKKYDSVIHCTVGIPWFKFEPNLSENGKVIDLTPSAGSILTCAMKKLTFSKKQLVPFLCSPKLEDLNVLVELSKEGKIKTLIDSRHALSRAEEAWARSMEGHATGKVIVEATEDK